MKQQLLPCLLSLFWAVALVGQADWTHYRDSCWQALEVQLERTDTIEPVLATLADLEVRYREQDELAAFYPPATRFLKTVYEYGHFDPARTYLARLARRARSWPPERQPLRGEALYQIGRSFYFTYEVDSCAHYVRYSLACYADDSPLTTWHHNLLAVMAEDDGQLDSAAFYYARAIHAADRQQDMDPGVLGGF
ncbi:MAG: hypothetical protein KDC54_20260, partial [Lewinella sp.]|nr:hypothetical protein [Lewinella sp.]